MELFVDIFNLLIAQEEGDAVGGLVGADGAVNELGDNIFGELLDVGGVVAGVDRGENGEHVVALFHDEVEQLFGILLPVIRPDGLVADDAADALGAHLIEEIAQSVVVIVECLPVDLRPVGQVVDGDVVDLLFAEQLPQSFGQNLFGITRHPKGKDLTDISEEYLQKVIDELNMRPRKCLRYRTPYEVFCSKVLHLT